LSWFKPWPQWYVCVYAFVRVWVSGWLGGRVGGCMYMYVCMNVYIHVYIYRLRALSLGAQGGTLPQGRIAGSEEVAGVTFYKVQVSQVTETKP
jgi:hypothetical protein